MLSTRPETPCQGLRKSSWLWRTSIADELVVPLKLVKPLGINTIQTALVSSLLPWDHVGPLVCVHSTASGWFATVTIIGLTLFYDYTPIISTISVLSSVHVRSTISSIHLVLS
ncbi:hypothetical protein Taro_046695, partial [Colocasia esculenta]|nr:hypothetical protein [Colocasia esculenta]